MTKKHIINGRKYRFEDDVKFTVVALWHNLYIKYRESKQYEKATRVLRFIRQINHLEH